MGGVNIYLKKDLLPLIAYPGNSSRRHRLKKIPGDDNTLIKKQMQLARWWATDHGIPRNAVIGWEGRVKGDELLHIWWNNSLEDIVGGLYHATHFWKLKDKDGLYNLMRDDHWHGCDRCAYNSYLEEPFAEDAKIKFKVCFAWWNAARESTRLENGDFSGPRYDIRIGQRQINSKGVEERWDGNMWRTLGEENV